MCVIECAVLVMRECVNARIEQYKHNVRTSHLAIHALTSDNIYPFLEVNPPRCGL